MISFEYKQIKSHIYGLISLVELRGLEPLSKKGPTFKHLQFSLTFSKTIPTAQTAKY